MWCADFFNYQKCRIKNSFLCPRLRSTRKGDPQAIQHGLLKNHPFSSHVNPTLMPMYYRDFPVGRGGFPDGEIYQKYPKLRMHITVFYLLQIHYLVGGFNPSERYQSVGMIIPNIWKNVPSHQPAMIKIKDEATERISTQQH